MRWHPGRPPRGTGSLDGAASAVACNRDGRERIAGGGRGSGVGVDAGGLGGGALCRPLGLFGAGSTRVLGGELAWCGIQAAFWGMPDGEPVPQPAGHMPHLVSMRVHDLPLRAFPEGWFRHGGMGPLRVSTRYGAPPRAPLAHLPGLP